VLWRSAPLEILMRLNASIATLVLAGLSLTPAPLLATTAHHAAHKTAKTQTPAKQHAKTQTTEVAAKSHTSKRRRKSRSQAPETPAQPTVSRVRSTSRTRKEPQKVAAIETSRPIGNESVADATPRKATSADFMNAAAGVHANAEDAPRPTTGVSHPPDNDEEGPRSPTPEKSAPESKPATSARLHATPEPASKETAVEEAPAPVFEPNLYNKRGHLIMPPPLKGSHEILVRQNVVADRDGLDRIKDDDDLERMRAAKLLVSLPASTALEVDDRLPGNRRYCRPWTAQFLAALSRAHYARFHTPLQVNSAVRTVEFQQRLQRTNGNAAPAEGETASPHLTGQAVDLAKHGLSLTEIAWLRGYLMPLVQQGKIDVEEEFQQSCFHISVYKRYMPSETTPKREIATRHSGTATLAAAIP
jgi:hypothetical protein